VNNTEKAKKKREHQNNLLKQVIERPVGYLISHKISPNFLSYIGFACSLSAAFFIAIGSVRFNPLLAWPASFLLLWSGIFDILDGAVARRAGEESKAGAFLDSNLDRLSDAVIVLGFIYGGFINFLHGYLLVFLVVMISYTRSRAENEGVNMKGVGLMERAERIIFLFVVIILETWIYFLTGLTLGTPFTLFLPFVMIIYTSLLLFTVGQRLVFAFKKLKISETK
jgi:archaetidylinositol phosphate synthase